MPIRQPNIQQQQAIDSTAATISVIAGPGTGKTFTLTERICSLINQKRVSPKQILAITFTRKARNEMETRLRAKSSDSTPLPYVMTLH
ncbi:UvrD-helicase domain-containing protein, partial [candidate division WWE3 bacterium]|nr:UvrD-helicase domain-containing protein [candidate division WWE3 bacterium]